MRSTWRSLMQSLRKIAWTLFCCLAMLNGPMLGSESQKAAQQQVTEGKPDAKVWVNTRSRVYHCPGTRWYGNTKSGEYMTQKQAQDKGYRPAYGKVCQ